MRIASGNRKWLSAIIIFTLLFILACTTGPLTSNAITSMPVTTIEPSVTPSPVVPTDTPTPGLFVSAPTPDPRPTIAWPQASRLDVYSTDTNIVARFGPGRYSSFALSPDGKTLAVAEATGITLLNAVDFEPIWHIDTPTGNSNAVFSSDGSILATSEGSTHITVRDSSSGAELHTYSMDNYQSYIDLAISPDNHYLAAKGYLRPTYVWDLRTDVLLYTLDGVTEYSAGLLFSPNSRYLVSSQGGYEYLSGLLLWDMSNGRTVFKSGRLMASVSFTSDSQYLLLGNTGSKVDLRPGASQYQLTGGDPVYGFGGWSPDDKLRVCYAFCGDNSDPQAIIEDSTGKVRTQLEDPEGLSAFFGLGLRFSPDGVWIAGSSGDYYNQSRLFIWDAKTGKLQHDLKSDVGSGITWSPDSKTFYATSYYDDAIFAWDAITGKPLRALQGSGSIATVQWTQDGSAVDGWWNKFNSVQPSIDIQLHHDMRTGETTVKENSPRPFAIIRPGSTWSALWAGSTITVTDTSSGQSSQLTGHFDQITALAWQPNGDVLASGSTDHTVILWDIAQAKPLLTLFALPGAVRGLTWSPDGKYIAAASGSDVLIWDAKSGALNQHLHQHAEPVNALAWSPDGHVLASASDDKTILLWDTASWKVENTLRKHTRSVLSLAWSSDGIMLASGSDDGTVIVWQVAR